jgi:pimeloyl-ACP methyl ester carboxylesterase
MGGHDKPESLVTINRKGWSQSTGIPTVAELKALQMRTLVVSDKATRLPIQEIVRIFATECPHWSFHTLAEGGHMAPLTHPERVNPIIRAFLDADSAGFN